MNRALLDAELDKLYPSTDGVEMGESVRHINLMTFLYDNFCYHFLGQKVAVHADLFWYPVEGKPKIRRAPDIMVILDCEMAERTSYRQFLDGGHPATMVIEILSASNDTEEMKKRRAWYQKYKVSEYYEIDEENNEVSVWLLRDGKFVKQTKITSFTSPATGIRFDWSGESLVVMAPDGTPFINGHQIRNELREARRLHEEARQQAIQEARLLEQETRLRLEAEARIAELQRQLDLLRGSQDPSS